MNLRKLIEEYLEEARLMQIATAKNNQPWACTVYFAHDRNLNFYWISKSTRRHSEEIRNNSSVAGVIVLPHTPGNKVRGLQFKGIAHELVKKDHIVKAMEYYAKRYNMPKERVNGIINNTDGHIPYQIQPKLIVLFDEVNFPENPRQEYPL